MSKQLMYYNLKIGRQYPIDEVERLGFKKIGVVNVSENKTLNSFAEEADRYEKDDEIYLMIKSRNNTLMPIAYYNLENGETTEYLGRFGM